MNMLLHKQMLRLPRTDPQKGQTVDPVAKAGQLSFEELLKAVGGGGSDDNPDYDYDCDYGYQGSGGWCWW